MLEVFSNDTFHVIKIIFEADCNWYVQVRASAVFVPEASDPNGGDARCYYYSYSIRMSLLPEGCMLDGSYYSSCQLYSRHWIIRSKDVIVSNVQGEAVIGKVYFLLLWYYCNWSKLLDP